MLSKHIRDYWREWTVAAVFLLAYFPIFLWMWDRCTARDSYYSHAVFVPFASAYLLWLDRGEVASVKKEPFPGGIWLIIFGVIVLLLSSLFRVYFTAAFTMPIVLSGVILVFFGKEFFRRIFFPVAFLVFMIPLPEVLITEISFQLKMFAAQIATSLLNNHLRIPAIREGSLIKMRNASVMVEDVCSGLKYLISLTALGSIFAYLLKGPWWKKTILFLFTIPISILTNVFRIIVLSFVSEVWGSQYASGLFHDLTGLLGFALAFVLLWIVSKVIE